ncbi:MAG: chorismate mutase, partial [Candidatus Firestonebacteria bacterium]
MSLKKIRNKIDGIDGRLLSLLNERAELALQVKNLKTGGSSDVYVPDREAEVLGAVLKRNKGPFPSESVKAIYG